MYVIQNSLEFRLPYGSQDICCWQSKMATTKEQETAKSTKLNSSQISSRTKNENGHTRPHTHTHAQLNEPPKLSQKF